LDHYRHAPRAQTDDLRRKGGIIYTARSSGEFWAYKPSSMIVNSEVEACVDSNKLVITRPDGKQYKPTIIRRERDQSAPSGK
jgi:hypothetical protein